MKRPPLGDKCTGRALSNRFEKRYQKVENSIISEKKRFSHR